MADNEGRELDPIADRSPVEWVAERLKPWTGPSVVANWIPEGFERYARIPIRWEGRLEPDMVSYLAPLLEEHTSTPDSSWYCVWSGYGGLDLVEDLAIEITPEITGSGRRYLLFRIPVKAAPDLRIRTVSYPLVAYRPRFLRWFTRPPTQIEPEWYGPNFWWPDDRAWFVSTEVDGRSSYLGGSRALIDRFESDPKLQVVPARLEDGSA